MPCIPIKTGRRTGFVCLGNEPVEVHYKGCCYRFEWTAASGWVPVNRDGSRRISAVPKAAWSKVEKMPRPRD